MTVQEIGVY